MSRLVYVTRKIPENGIKMLEEKGYSVDSGEKEEAPTKAELIEALSKKPYEVLVSFLTDSIDKDTFDACKTLTLVAQYSVGVDNIDIQEAHTRNVVIANTPGVSSLAVAEHTVALMLALTTRTVEGDEYMREGKYLGWSPYLLNGTDLSGKTVGILGGGKIGSCVASILRFGFNCTIIYSDIKRNEALEKKYDASFVDKDTLFSTSDIISIHTPLLPSTKHLVDREALSKMKKSSYLVNTARGPIVDEQELVLALKENRIRGAGLDVYEFEPQVSKELLTLPQVVLTPHIASSRDSARYEMSDMVAKNIISFFETGKALHEISPQL